MTPVRAKGVPAGIIAAILILLAVHHGKSWTFLWGFLGTFIGVPITIAILTFCREHPRSRWISDLLGNAATGTASARAG